MLPEMPPYYVGQHSDVHGNRYALVRMGQELLVADVEGNVVGHMNDQREIVRDRPRRRGGRGRDV